jgi:hypothetical protein
VNGSARSQPNEKREKQTLSTPKSESPADRAADPTNEPSIHLED